MARYIFKEDLDSIIKFVSNGKNLNESLHCVITTYGNIETVKNFLSNSATILFMYAENNTYKLLCHMHDSALGEQPWFIKLVEC